MLRRNKEGSGRVGKGLDTGPRANRGRAGDGDAWGLWPGGLIRPWCSSALAQPAKCCVKSAFHCKGTWKAWIKAQKLIRSLEKIRLRVYGKLRRAR